MHLACLLRRAAQSGDLGDAQDLAGAGWSDHGGRVGAAQPAGARGWIATAPKLIHRRSPRSRAS